ncbi:DUF169 domain-containing protein [Desulfosporosinus sp. OT]|uniref:DUF169 domain-containing protein n=1 Tax=Desulfosporosinus sp. OT TaxID=913865 RepID=UPI000223AB02|nr:DUF169 domain-containing protein [Desulfosporosinus sp. OT]EGW36922.1 hypothetical protein DOT_5112 [Desulfosporosinus sp. OT]
MNEADVEKAYALLNLDRQIVGIKIVKSKTEFEQIQAKELTYPLAYCVAVKHATNGIALKMTKEFSGCGGSTRALGLTLPTESFFNGQDGCDLGLYASPEIAASVAKQMKFCPPDTYGVIIKPLDQFEIDPDVVLMVGDSYQIMRVIQGYSYVYGILPNFNMLGNQAVCVECTSYPLMTNQINFSVFCSGTRFLAKWLNTEVAVGIPFEKFGKVIEGVRLTVSAVEMNERKKVIQAKLVKLGYAASEISFDDPYYLRLERQKQKQKQRREAN